MATADPAVTPSVWGERLAADPQVSPCTGVCLLDRAGALCTGCGRRAEEIMAWGTASPAARAAIWARLPARRAALGLRLQRLAWGPAQVAGFVRASLVERSGSWVLGVPGGLAEFTVGADESLELEVSGPATSAVTPRGAVHLVAVDGVRAFTSGAVDSDGGQALLPGAIQTGDQRGRGGPPPGPVVLVVTRPTRGRAPARVVTALGPDRAAVRPDQRHQHRFDLGLGSEGARFCVRSDHPGLLERLRAAVGRPWTELVAGSGSMLVEVSPDRVVETPLGRVEVATPIPPVGGRSPDGPHTHLLAEYLAAEGEAGAGGSALGGFALPAGWTAAATWYPTPPDDGG